MKYIGMATVSIVIFLMGWFMTDVFYGVMGWAALSVNQGLAVAMPQIAAALIVRDIWN